MTAEATGTSRVRIGRIAIDPVTLRGAVDEIGRMIARGEGGTVFTPNVDHVVQAEEDARFCEAYEDASLSVVDGMPIVWASRLLGARLPERVAGSDLVMPLMERAEREGWRVFLFGGAPGIGEKAKERLLEQLPKLQVVGTDSPHVRLDDPPSAREAVLAKIREARPDIVLVALGAPKQEIFCHEAAEALRPAVLLGVGATLDFIAGAIPRAPRILAKTGFEWLYRFSREPKRLFRRYFLRDPKFLLIVARDLRRARGGT